MIKLSPVIENIIHDFVSEKKLVKNFVHAFGSYVNIMFPENMNKNIEKFKSVFKKHHLKGSIFFAYKSNKSNTLVSQAESQSICIDVASINELKKALINGFTGNRIEITGPKPFELIYLGLKHQATFNVDSINELKSILSIAESLKIKNKVKILLRLSAFKSEYVKVIPKDSKFGIPVHKIIEAMEIMDKHNQKINFLGFSFHLDTVELKEKIVAIENSLLLFDVARDYGFDPYILNIGGGFKVNYLKDENEWNETITGLKESVLGKREKFVWGNQGFGLFNDKNTLRGVLNIYNYFNKTTGSDYLDEILSSPLPSFENRPVGTVLCENMIDLYIEPGRALLDQTGITAAKIIQVKESAQGEILAVLNMRRTDLVFGDQEIFIDPVILSDEKEENNSGEKYGVYLAGCLCLESDIIYKHKIFVDHMPKAGDIVVFMNTAAYYMDFNITDTDKLQTDTKLAVIKKENDFKWFTDGNYYPGFN